MKHILRIAGQKGWILLPLITSVMSFVPGGTPTIALEFPPTKKGAPARTSGGGVRDPKDLVTALLPNSGIHSLVGDRITVFVNVPKGISQNGFLLIYNADQTVFEQEFQLPNSAGLIGITLPQSIAESMDINQVYDWEFAVLPDGVLQAEEQVAIGQMQRVEMNDMSCPQADDPLLTAEHFAQLSIWQETLVAIAPYKETYLEEWQALLSSAQLESLVDIPWVGVLDLEDS